jgi:hypothetical protein
METLGRAESGGGGMKYKRMSKKIKYTKKRNDQEKKRNKK